MGTVAFIWFIPILLLIAAAFCANGFTTLFNDLFADECGFSFLDNASVAYTVIIVVLFLISCFFILRWYGYVMAGKIYPQNDKIPCDSENGAVIYRTPADRTQIYINLCFPVIWYLFWTAVMNVFDLYVEDLLGAFIQIFVMFTPYGLAAYELLEELTGIEPSLIDNTHFILLLNLLYYGFLIMSFAMGERYYIRKKNETRKPLNIPRKKLIIYCSVIICLFSVSEFTLYQHRKNVVPEARTARSYGFAYEGGYSSTDLKPYYVENESNILAKLDEPSTFTIYDPLDMPIMDGAEAVYPVYSAFANACYYNIAEIQEYGKEQRRHGSIPDEYIVMPIRFTNTIRAYEKLLDGEVDICFGAKPSEEQLKMAEEQGKEVVLTPIGKEGFVFFVNDANPVDSLTTEQLKGIYSGKINNWRKVGGTNDKILAFQRPENSGSQTMMKYFMGDTPLKDPLEAEYYESMGGVLKDVAAYDNGKTSIAYSFRYFATIMAEESSGGNGKLSNTDTQGGIKFLAVDGVYPTEDTIRSGEYPLTTELYAITVNDPNREDNIYIYYKDTIEPFIEWMTGPQGQQIVAETGYVSLR